LEARVLQGILRLDPPFELDVIPRAYWSQPWLSRFILAIRRADFSVQPQDGFLAFRSENDSRGVILGFESRHPTQAESGITQV
jgi:hypothetical protein